MKTIQFETHVSYDDADGLYRVEFTFEDGDNQIEYGDTLAPLLATAEDVFRWMELAK